MEHVPTFGGVPQVRRRRWPRVVALALVAFAVLLGGGFGSGLVAVYDAPGNAGIVVGWPCHNIGLEVRGDPGFFADSCG